MKRFDVSCSWRYALVPVLAVMAFVTLAPAATHPACNPFGLDSDLDGISDSCDRCPASYDPSNADADGDYVGNVCDNCVVVSNPGSKPCGSCNPLQPDDDGDGAGDACDICPGLDDEFDPDGDGVASCLEHPRLLFDESQIAGLRNIVTDTNDPRHEAWSNSILAQVADLTDGLSDSGAPGQCESASAFDSPAHPDDFQLVDGTRIYGSNLSNLALASLITDDPADLYLNKALEYIDALLSYDSWLEGDNCHLTRASFARGLALAYDMLYDEPALGDCPAGASVPCPSRREAIVDKLIQEIGDYDDTGPQVECYLSFATPCGPPPNPIALDNDGEYRRYQTGNAIYRDKAWQNQFYDTLSAVGIAAYAIQSDVDPAAVDVETWRTFAHARFDATRPWLPTDGSWHEGLTYQSKVLEGLAPFELIGARLDTSRQYPQTPFFTELPHFLRNVYFDPADGGGSVRYSNAYNSQVGGELVALGALVSRLDDDDARGLYSELASHLTAYVADPLIVLAHDGSAVVGTPAAPESETILADIGIAVARKADDYLALKSGWPGGVTANTCVLCNSDSSCPVEESCPGWVQNLDHDHQDQNSIVYAHEGVAILHDPGEGRYDTEKHNTLSLDDNGTIVRQYHPGTELEVPLAGGPFDQYRLSSQQTPLANQPCPGNPSLQVLSGESGAIYPDTSVGQFYRQVVMAEDYFVVIDVVDGPHDARFHFHTPGSIAVSGATASYEVDGVILDHDVKYPAGTTPACADGGCAAADGIVVDIEPDSGLVEHLSVFRLRTSAVSTVRRRTNNAAHTLIIRFADGSREKIEIDRSSWEVTCQ